MAKTENPNPSKPAATTNRISELTEMEVTAGTALASRKERLSPLTNERSFRAAALASVRETKKQARERIQKMVEEKLKESTAARNYLAVLDYIRNAPAGAALHLYATDKPERAVPQLINDMEASGFRFQTVGVVANLDPETTDNIGQFLADKARNGTMVQLIGEVEPGSYEVLISRYIKKPLASRAPGRDQFQVFADRVYSAQHDPNKVCVRSLVPAFLGARALRDQEGIGEGVAGDLNDGSGSKGLLKGLKLSNPVQNDHRLPLVKLGLNVCRDWPKVGGAVVYSNRSLLDDPSSRYYCASPTRIRLGVMADFYKTTEHHVILRTRPTKAVLEKSLGLFNSVLDQLKAEGWLTSGRAWVDYTEAKLKINVLIKPTQPANEVVIEVSEDEPVTGSR